MNQHYIHKRKGGIYYFVMNVPRKAKGKFVYKQVWRSLRTRDKFEASRKASEYISEFTFKFQDDANNSLNENFESINLVSKKLGFEYQDFEALCNVPVAESIKMLSPQLSSLQTRKTISKLETAALGGAVKVGALSMPQLFARFKELAPEKTSGCGPYEAKRKWRRFQLATEDFQKLMPGHPDVLKIEARHANEYRAKLIQSVNDSKFKSDVAKKRLQWLRMIFAVVLTSDYPQLTNPFGNLRGFKIEDAAKRKPFTEEEVQVIKRELAASKISDEAKAIITLGQYTGCSVRELVLLEVDDIRLDADIPYIHIQPNSARKKVKNGGTRHRSVPLIGEALEAMRKFPNGFPTYRNEKGPGRMNGTMSDFFTRRTPGKGHYSFRHRIDDLLKNSKCDIGVKAGVMGHALAGNNLYYGEGYALQVKLDALKRAFGYHKIYSEGGEC